MTTLKILQKNSVWLREKLWLISVEAHRHNYNFMDVHSKPKSHREVSEISCGFKNPGEVLSDC